MNKSPKSKIPKMASPKKDDLVNIAYKLKNSIDKLVAMNIDSKEHRADTIGWMQATLDDINDILCVEESN